MKKNFFSNYIMAGYPLLWVESHEEHRTIGSLCQELSKSKETYKVYTWDRVDGVRRIEIKDGILATSDPVDESDDPMVALSWLETQADDNSILFLKDYHHYAKKDPISRKIRNVLPKFKACGKVLIVLSPTVDIPMEIEKEITVIRFDLPDRDQLKLVLKSVCEAAGAPYPKDDEAIIDASLGMTAFEAENAYSVSMIERKKFDPQVIRREKAAIVKKTGILEVIETTENMDTVGGVEVLKEWLQSRKNTFTVKAKESGVDPARGLLLIGLPGTGKSLTAKVVSAIWGRPLLRLDMGRIKDKYVGESEGRIRHVLNMAETIAPCILWIS